MTEQNIVAEEIRPNASLEKSLYTQVTQPKGLAAIASEARSLAALEIEKCKVAKSELQDLYKVTNEISDKLANKKVEFTLASENCDRAIARAAKFDSLNVTLVAAEERLKNAMEQENQAKKEADCLQSVVSVLAAGGDLHLIELAQKVRSWHLALEYVLVCRAQVEAFLLDQKTAGVAVSNDFSADEGKASLTLQLEEKKKILNTTLVERQTLETQQQESLEKEKLVEIKVKQMEQARDVAIEKAEDAKKKMKDAAQAALEENLKKQKELHDIVEAMKEK